MTNTIQIKSFFSNWTHVSREQAKRFALSFMAIDREIDSLSDRQIENCSRHIELLRKRVRGIEIEELLRG